MNVVIIGAGQAGLQVADSLRSEGFDGPITLVADEQGVPYQRPPLSKDYLTPGKEPLPLPLRGEAFFTEKGIRLLSGVSVSAVDRTSRRVVLNDQQEVPYEHLVFATGARNRELGCPGAALQGIHGLRTLSDAEHLNSALSQARNVVVIGAGFIGLEFAVAARTHGCSVTVLEFAPRPMGRALTPGMSEWFIGAHTALGVNLRLSEGIDRFESDPEGHVMAAVSTTGQHYPADLVVVGVGVLPNDALAAESGLETNNGILVDATLRTSDPRVLAVGDCANFPNIHTGAQTRLESVQNATDHGRHAARTILGGSDTYTALPWFWSTQGPYRLQMAGIAGTGDDTLVLGDQDAAKFSILCFRDGVMAAVESVNMPADHIAARKLLTAGARITRAQAESEGFSLKSAAASAGQLAA
ncbi:NAD(P)/FAD-dependent oxidoreductase [Paenarthrobacter sp. NPDC090520]|uniref:NAD(P)/FAD-dependent oxidoreductase n=1 Tax=Paenarthrobacter sp. NPDC090520 TaxID=3364382 RepID=UPI0037FFCA1B